MGSLSVDCTYKYSSLVGVIARTPIGKRQAFFVLLFPHIPHFCKESPPDVFVLLALLSRSCDMEFEFINKNLSIVKSKSKSVRFSS